MPLGPPCCTFRLYCWTMPCLKDRSCATSEAVVGGGVAGRGVVREAVDGAAGDEYASGYDVVGGKGIGVGIGRILVDTGGLAEVRGVMEDGISAAEERVAGRAEGRDGEAEAGLDVGIIGGDAGVLIAGDGTGVGAGLAAGDIEEAAGNVEVGEAGLRFR